MASLPPQQAPRRSPPASISDGASHTYEEQIRTHASSPVLVNGADFSSSEAFTPSESISADDPLQEQATSIPQQSHPQGSVDEARRCWICFSDETEDTPESGVWRTPCGCNLTAHETCLLQWVADIEAPKGGRSTAAPADIKCPQCKAKIHLARPRSYVVEAVGQLEKLTGRALLPAVVLGMSYTIILGCSHHGAHALRMIFGSEEAERMLEPLRPSQWSQVERYAMIHFPAIATPLFRGWRGLRVELGLPLIPVALVASRTRLADAVLPILPIVFFATHHSTSESLRIGYWPPSSALTFVLLPYVRSAYDEYMQRVWAPLEKAWVEEVKPRLNQEEAENNQNDAAAAAEEEEDVDEIINIEIGVDMDLFGDDTDDEDEEQIPPLEDIPAGEQNGVGPPQEAPPLHAPPQDDLQFFANDDDAAPAPEIHLAQPQQQAQQQAIPPRPQQRRHEIDLLSTARRAADGILGALLFPTISAGCGELLRLVLPLSWTVATKHIGGTTVRGGMLDRLWNGSGSGVPERILPTGLLQTRWGRSVVGGCLFVLLKDAIRIYCRWRMAVSFRERRVRDWDRKLGRLIN